jgi:hypothetical protein
VRFWEPVAENHCMDKKRKDSRKKYAFDLGINGYKLKTVLPYGTVFPPDFGSIPGWLFLLSTSYRYSFTSKRVAKGETIFGMSEEEAIERAHEDERQGKPPSTQAGEFVREEMEHIREGEHGARSPEQAIAIGLSKARRAGVKLPPPKRGKERIKRQAKRDLAKGRAGRRKKPSRKRSRATKRALKRESRRSASRQALSRHAKRVARQRSARSRSAAAKKAARTRKRRR